MILKMGNVEGWSWWYDVTGCFEGDVFMLISCVISWHISVLKGGSLDALNWTIPRWSDTAYDSYIGGLVVSLNM